jgi:hypothetical protein
VNRKLTIIGERIGDSTIDWFSRFVESPWIYRVIIGFVIYAYGIFSGYIYFKFQ